MQLTLIEMVYLKGSEFRNEVKKEAEQKDYSHLPKKCYWCSKIHNTDKVICEDCQVEKKGDGPSIFFKGNGFVNAALIGNGSVKAQVDKDTGQRVHRKYDM